MARTDPPIFSFNGGEIDERAVARADTESYASRASTFENWFATVQGGKDRAPGTWLLFELGAPSGAFPPVLKTFSYNREAGNGFALLFGDESLNWFTADGIVQLEAGAGTLGEWASPPAPPAPTLPPAAPPAPPPPDPPPPRPPGYPDTELENYD